MYRLKDVSISYNKEVILEKTTKELLKSYTLLGENGAGKTSFAKMLLGELKSDGKLFLNGVDIESLEPKAVAKAVAYVPTKLDIFEQNLTLFEFVLLARYPYKPPFVGFSEADEAMVVKSLEFVGLSDKVKQSMAKLSSGENALARIATALVGKAKYIIFDEPTANLDPKNKKKLQGS